MAVPPVSMDLFALATLPTAADEAGGPPSIKFYELRDNLRNCSRHFLSRLSAMSCSRHSSLIVLGPRSDASTISVFCWAVNFRYFLISLNSCSFGLSGPCCEAHRTRSPLRFGPPGLTSATIPSDSFLTAEVSTRYQGPGQDGEINP